MHALRTETVCPKDNDKVFNLLKNSEPHRHDDAIISVRHSRQEASVFPLNLYFPSSASTTHIAKKKKQGSLLLLLCNCKSPNILSLHIPLVAFLPPLLLHNLVGIMWQGWIFWVTAVWLPLLTRDKGSGKNFTAFYLLLINSQLLCLPVFYVLSRNLYFATLQPLLLSRRTKISRMLPHCIIVK